MKNKHDWPLQRVLDACRNRDEAAQFELYRRYYGYALTVSLHYCRNRMEAEEVVQDAFVKIFQSLLQTDANMAFRPWMRVIVVRTAINKYHAGRQWGSVLSMDAVQHHPSVDNRALADLEEEDFYLLLQVLSPAYRLVFNLFVLEGLTHPEIAELLQISVGTSKSNLAKARRQLQQLSSRLSLSTHQIRIKP